MTFDVPAESYDAFMGRYSRRIAPQLADLAGIDEGQRAIDVGCGPGALTAELVRRLGPSAVAAVDPSPPFVKAVLARYPGVDVRLAPAENLPFPAAFFDAAIAQLVVHFMSDPVAGLTEMRRVTRPEGVVAACVWDHAGGLAPLSAFWRAARELDATADDESQLAGVREGHLAELMQAAGLHSIEATVLTADHVHATFDEWWEPFTMGVGPAGAYVTSRDEAARVALREACRRLLGGGPFTIEARAWAAHGRA